ncbi:MAG TPA: DUF4169 family protein [Parvibaculum sp.]|uniref:DUF4169 family protein n=1 Tax=Parvibaculum sp. TaxID=2024848 RepID=UPI002BB55B98|nr:DUF4169 family protein [Parvibaculum sp.]HMM13835.1 DUF4169 family protein [Parvibaculum sp.]
MAAKAISLRREFLVVRCSPRLRLGVEETFWRRLLPICGQIMVSDNGNIIDLSKLRKNERDEKKRRERAEKETRAAANRVRFGRTGAEKRKAKLEHERQARLHEGNRIERKPAAPDDDDLTPPEGSRG